jgi:hypothetical protein
MEKENQIISSSTGNSTKQTLKEDITLWITLDNNLKLINEKTKKNARNETRCFRTYL